MPTDKVYGSLPRLKTFRLLLKAAQDIRGNLIKVKTDQQLLIGFFQPQHYYSKTEMDNSQHWPAKFGKLLREADVVTTHINVQRLRERLGRGIWRGQTPFGHEKQEDGTMRPCPKIFIVSFIFNSFLQTKSLGETRKQLASLGFDLIESRIAHILKNGIYCGVVTYGSERVKLDGIFVPVVTEKVFESVQDIFVDNRKLEKAKPSLVKLLPLTGFAVDSYSGINLSGSGGYLKKAGDLRLFYRVNFNRRKEDRRPFQIRADELETIFKEHLVMQFKGRAKETHSYLQQSHEAFKAVVPRLIENLEKELRQSSERTDTSNDELVDPRIVRLSMIHEQLEQLKYFQNEESFIEYGMELITRISNIWEDSDYEAKRIIQLLIFPNGISFDNDNGIFVNNLGVIF
ncbi:MAG TPA: recombinase family protein [Cyclobacteriaceae bacterium]|jgi:hypothetical protein|nr:recombinase family protein [Cyclobacteriaceae bacterium]